MEEKKGRLEIKEIQVLEYFYLHDYDKDDGGMAGCFCKDCENARYVR